MARLMHFSRLALVLTALATIAAASLSAEPAHAVVYCKTVGVPKGCVVRPVARPRHVVYCKTRGVPKGCVMR